MGLVLSKYVHILSGWSAGDPGGPGTDFGQQFIEKTMKKKGFLIFLLLDFAIFPYFPIQTAGPQIGYGQQRSALHSALPIRSCGRFQSAK